MSKVKELEQDLDSMAKILAAATENFEYFNYLHSPLTSKEAHFIEGNNFLKHLRYVAWQMTVIELSKLISPSENQKFNVFKLIKKFEGVHFKAFNIPDTTIAMGRIGS